MITNAKRDDLIEIGARHRAAQLVTQAGYTLGIAHEDGAALEALLEPGFLAEVEEAKATVDRARGDKAIIAEEARDATRHQDQGLREAKVWRRRVAKRGARLVLQGKPIPEVLTRVTRATGVAEILAHVTEMSAALNKDQAAMGGAAVAPLLDEAARLKAALAGADATQCNRSRELMSARSRWMMGIA